MENIMIHASDASRSWERGMRALTEAEIQDSLVCLDTTLGLGSMNDSLGSTYLA